MENQQVIFVENQGEILDRLRTTLMAARPDWQILSVADAATALELLSQRKVGIVLANFGADNARCEDFFRAVRDSAPQVIRMGLLPEELKNSVANSPECAHEYIADNCDAVQIEALIDRGLKVWAHTQKNPKLAELIADLDTLPTPPTLYFDIRDKLESADGSSRDIAEMIARDPAITARLLKVANSGFYASPRTIADLYQAITLLGMDMVLALVLSANLYDQLPLPGVNLDVLWKHSLAVATLAKEIAVQEGASRVEVTTCAIAGLLHDVGELVFLANAAEAYYNLVRRSGGDETLLLQMELDEFGVGHPELGAHILSLWGLPEEVVQAIAHHHTTDWESLPFVPLPRRAVCVAEWLLQNHNLGEELYNGDTQTEGDKETNGDAADENELLDAGKKILCRLVEEGLIQESHNPVDALFG